MKRVIPVSVVVFSYNQELFVADAIESVFNLDYPELEIILSDDCSTDRTFEILEHFSQTYRGKHNVKVNCNERNLGLASHFSKLMQMASSDVIIPLAGDDICMPNRVTQVVSHFKKGVYAVSSGSERFNQDVETARARATTFSDIEVTPFDITAYDENKFFHIDGATRAYHSDLFKFYPPIDPSCPTEDSVMLLRALLLGKVVLTSEKLLLYRWHGGNLSDPENIKKMNFGDIYRQYRRDIDVAVEGGLISRERATKLKGLLLSRCLKTSFGFIADKYKSKTFRKLSYLFYKIQFKMKYK